VRKDTGEREAAILSKDPLNDRRVKALRIALALIEKEVGFSDAD